MLVAVSVYGTEESSTSACKPRESNLLLTRQASVLFLLSIFLPVFFTLGPPQTATPSNVAQVGFCLLVSGPCDWDDWNCGSGCVQICWGWSSSHHGTCPLLYTETCHTVRGRTERCWHVGWWGLLLLDNIFVADRAKSFVPCIAVESASILAESWVVLLDVGVTRVHPGYFKSTAICNNFRVSCFVYLFYVSDKTRTNGELLNWTNKHSVN